MTSPIVIRETPAAEQVQRGLAPLLQALRFRQNQQLRQQALDIQQQQVQLQSVAQRSLERERVIGRGLEFARMFGPDILEDPSIAEQLESAGIKPATILKRFRDEQKAAQDAAKQEREVLVNSFPQRLRPALRLSLGLMDQGAPAEQVSQSFSLLAQEAVDEETIATIDSEFPTLKDLPPDRKLDAFASLRMLQAQAKLGIGPAAEQEIDRQLKETQLELRRLAVQQARSRDPDLELATEILTLIERAMDTQTLSLKGLLGKTQEEVVRELFGPTGLRAFQNARRKVLESGAGIGQQ